MPYKTVSRQSAIGQNNHRHTTADGFLNNGLHHTTQQKHNGNVTAQKHQKGMHMLTQKQTTYHHTTREKGRKMRQ